MKITRKQIRQIAFKLLTEAKTITDDPDLEKRLRKHVGGRQGLTGNPIFQMAKRGSMDQGKGKIDPLLHTGDQVRSIHKKIKTSNKDIDRDAMEIYLKRYNMLVNKNKKMKPGEAERKAYSYMQSQYAKKRKSKEDDEGNFLDDPPSRKEKGDKEEAIKPKPKPKPRRKASANEDVRELQKSINKAVEKGYDATDYDEEKLKEDGIYGSRTRSAIGKLFQDEDFEQDISDLEEDDYLRLPDNYNDLATACLTKKSGAGKTAWIRLVNAIVAEEGNEDVDFGDNKYDKMNTIIEVALMTDEDEESENIPSEGDDPPPQDDDSQEEEEKMSVEKRALLSAINISEEIIKFWSGVGNEYVYPFNDENIDDTKYHGIKGMLFNDDEAKAKKYYEEVLFEKEHKIALDDLAKLGKLGKALAFFFRQDLKFDIAKAINQAVGKDLSWSMPPKDIDKSLIPDGLLSDPEIENSQQKFTIQGAFFDI